jgi:hypothetical protein
VAIDLDDHLLATDIRLTKHPDPRSNSDLQPPVRFSVAVGRQRERVGEFATRDEAMALINELAATYGRATVAELALEFSVGRRPPVVQADGNELIDMASAIHLHS